MENRKMTAEERRWRAESDAETMARYEEIMGSTTRRNAAIKVAREKAEDLNKRANAMSNVASKASKPRKK